MSGPGAGRYAPSPSGDLHLGNLRTALLAWLFARHSGRRFLLRVEDLGDRAHVGVAESQKRDLRAIGIDWDDEPMVQSDRIDVYDSAIDRLAAAGRTYECFCTRREILDAPTAPHAPPGAYPGTCRDLDDRERDSRRVDGRAPAIRLRSDTSYFTIVDDLCGQFSGVVDDFVLRRGDGTASYNLAVVIDDGAQRIDQVVRADDLLSSTPRQAYLATLLGLPLPTYAHVPLVLNASGKRLAKRDGAVTLTDLSVVGVDAETVLSAIARSLGMAIRDSKPTAADLLQRFDPTRLPNGPWLLGLHDLW